MSRSRLGSLVLLALLIVALAPSLARAQETHVFSSAIWRDSKSVTSFLTNLNESDLYTDEEGIWVKIRNEIYWEKTSEGGVIHAKTARGLRAYVDGVPYVKMKIKNILTPLFNASVGNATELVGFGENVLVLSHPRGTKALVINVRIYRDVEDLEPSIYALVRVYDLEQEAFTWTWIGLINVTELPLTITADPVIFSYEEGDEVKINIGFTITIESESGGTTEDLTEPIKAGWDSYSLNVSLLESVTLSELEDVLSWLYGWYVWVGSGLSLYLKDYAVYTAYLTVSEPVEDQSVKECYMELSYPHVESRKIDPVTFWRELTEQSVRVYKKPVVGVVGWQLFWMGIIPLCFAIGCGFVVRRLGGRIAGLFTATAMMILIGILFGFGWLELLSLLISVSIVTFISLRSGGLRGGEE